MKKILIYFLFVGLFNLSFLQKIQTKESVKINSPFLGCLDQKQKDHLIKLHSSFSHFIEKNYAASKKVFLNEVLNGELKKDIVFKSEDNSLIKQLRKDTFLNIAFKRVTAETRFSYLEKEEKRKAIEKIKITSFGILITQKSTLNV